MGGYNCRTCNKHVDINKKKSPWYPYCSECYKTHKNTNCVCETFTCGLCTCGIDGDKEDACNIGCCKEAGKVEDDSCSIF